MPSKSQHYLYHTWRDMKSRCYKPQDRHFDSYGGRGIKICPQWLNNFEQFIKDMGPRPLKHSIDRIDNNGDYTPENCRWATQTQQMRNQKVTRRVTIEGKTYVAADLADKCGHKTDTIVERANQGLTYKQVINKKRRRNLTPLTLGAAVSATVRSARTHCKQGHEWTPENTKMVTAGKYTWRSCRTCHRAKTARQGAAKRAASR